MSVLPEAGAMLDAARMKMIREAVAGAIAGLDASERDHSQLERRLGAGGGARVDAGAFDDPYFETRTRYEQLMKGKIEDLLRLIKPSVQRAGERGAR